MIIAIVVLPSPGGPASSTWSGALPRRSAPSRTSVQLLAHPGLADELGELPGPQRALDLPLVGVGERRDEPVGRFRSRPRPARASAARQRGSRRRPRAVCSACAAAAAAVTSTASPSARRSSPSSSSGRDGLRRRRRPASRGSTRPDCTWSRQAGRRRRRRHGARRPSSPGDRAGPSARARSAARPSADAGHPGQRVDVLGRDRAAQRVGAEHGEHRQRQPRADAAGGLQQLERRSARRRWRIRTGSARPRGPPARWQTWARSPGLSPARVPGVHCTSRPTPPTSIDRPSGRDGGHHAAQMRDHGVLLLRCRPAAVRPAWPRAAPERRRATVAHRQRQRVGGVRGPRRSGIRSSLVTMA